MTRQSTPSYPRQKRVRTCSLPCRERQRKPAEVTSFFNRLGGCDLKTEKRLTFNSAPVFASVITNFSLWKAGSARNIDSPHQEAASPLLPAALIKGKNLHESVAGCAVHSSNDCGVVSGFQLQVDRRFLRISRGEAVGPNFCSLGIVPIVVSYDCCAVGIATGFLIAALHLAGLASLTHTPSPMGFLNKLLQRPAHEKPFLLLVFGYPADDAVVPDIQQAARRDQLVSLPMTAVGPAWNGEERRPSPRRC